MNNKKTYHSPNIEKVQLDNDISLALESPWGDPVAFSALDFTTETMPVETLMPGL